MLSKQSIRKEVTIYLNGEIINNLIIDLIETSKDSDEIKLSDNMFEKVKILQKFNYKYIYGHSEIENYKRKGEKIIEEIFDYLIDLLSNYGHDYQKYSESSIELDIHFGRYLNTYKTVYDNEHNIPKRIVCDFIAGMTDNYALGAIKQIKIPKPIKFK